MVSENTYRKIIYDIIEGVKQHNADSKLSKRKVYSTFYRIAKVLIDRDIRDRKLYKNTDIYKTICINMIQVDANTCPCIELETGCLITRSEEKLPKLLNTIFGPLIYSVTTIIGNKKIDITTPSSAISKTKIKGVSGIYGFIENEYLYLTKDIEAVKMRAVFEGDITKYECDYKPELKESDCNNWLDRVTFIPDRLLSDVVSMSISELLKSFMQVPYDNLNDKQAS